MALQILTTNPERDYELLDSGNGEKLERFGNIVLSRPDPQALWPKKNQKLWKNIQGHFLSDDEKNGWNLDASVPEKWPVTIGGLKFWISPSPFKHVGVFPEQRPNWEWIQDSILNAKKTQAQKSKNEDGAVKDEPITVLNLFGYTGGATLAALGAGAEVCHVDASKASVTSARENAELSGLADKPVRWIVDDALAFVKREIRRGKTYDAIIMDPPAFGRGPKGEVWKIEERLTELLGYCKQIMKPEPVFFLINGYAAGYSALSYEYCLQFLIGDDKGIIEAGELTIQERNGKRHLPAGIFARWNAH